MEAAPEQKDPAQPQAEAEAPVDREIKNIGWAVKQLWNGMSLRRTGWNGQGQHVGLQRPDVHSKNTLPYVYLVTETGERVPWQASQTDLLAMDWAVVS